MSEQRRSSKPSLADIAQRAGVSTSAVSLALRDSPKVSDAKKKQIAQIAAELGYVQDPRVAELMQHLRTNRSEKVSEALGVIIPQLKKEEFDQFPTLRSSIDGIRLQASKMGYNVDLFVLEDLMAREERIRDIMIARGIHGVIALPCKKGVERLSLDFTDFSVTTIGYSIVEPNVNRVVPNYLQMMDEILEQSLALGYKRIGMIMPYKRAGGGTGRKLFLSSLLYYQSLIDQDLVVPYLLNSNATPERIKRWILEYKPEVIISSGDVLKIIEELGFRVPEDLGFMSMDLSEKPFDLAGVDHRHDLAGIEAVRLLVSDIHHSSKGIPEQPKIVMVDSHFRHGYSIRQVGDPIDVMIRNIPSRGNG